MDRSRPNRNLSRKILKRSKERRQQIQKAKENIYKISMRRKSKKEKLEDKLYRYSLKSKKRLNAEQIPFNRSRILPIRKSLGKIKQTQTRSVARGSLCRSSRVNLYLARKAYASMGIDIPCLTTMYFYYSEEKLGYGDKYVISKYESASKIDTGLVNLLDVDETKVVLKTYLTNLMTYSYSKRGYLVCPKLELEKLQKYASTCYFRLIIAGFANETHHAIGVLKTPQRMLVFQSWTAQDKTFYKNLIPYLTEILKQAFPEYAYEDERKIPKLWFCPDDFGEYFELQKATDETIFGFGQCAVWSLIVPYACMKFISELYEIKKFEKGDEFEMGDVYDFYKQGSEEWTFPDTYNEYMKELGLLDAIDPETAKRVMSSNDV